MKRCAIPSAAVLTILLGLQTAFGASMVKVSTHVEVEGDETGIELRVKNFGSAQVEVLDPADDGKILELSARIWESRRRDCTTTPGDVGGCFTAIFVDMERGITSVSCTGTHFGYCAAGYASRALARFAGQSPSAYSGCQTVTCPGID